MNNAQRLQLLHKTGKTVFQAKFLKNLWEQPGTSFKVTVKRMVDKKLLFRLSKGVYAITQDFNIYELANTMVNPSYVSFNSALIYHGVSFQVSSQITSASLFAYQRKINQYNLVYVRIKKNLLFSNQGVTHKNKISMASPERAMADCFYAGILPNIDNQETINPHLLTQVGKLYPRRVQLKLKKLAL